MSDTELLKLAASAVFAISKDFAASQHWWEGFLSQWNPLERDEDALPLAVKLGLIVECGAHRTIVFHPGVDESVPKIIEWYEGSGPCAATRRAIVRAAAEIGKRKQ